MILYQILEKQTSEFMTSWNGFQTAHEKTEVEITRDAKHRLWVVQPLLHEKVGLVQVRKLTVTFNCASLASR